MHGFTSEKQNNFHVLRKVLLIENRPTKKYQLRRYIKALSVCVDETSEAVNVMEYLAQHSRGTKRGRDRWTNILF